MSKFRLIGALLVSLALIGGAVWYRTSQQDKEAPSLLAVKDSGLTPEDNTFLNEILKEKTLSSPASAPENLTQTDLVGRSLFSEYVGLASQDRVTPENITSLASKYAENILNNNPAKTRKITELSIVSDSEENFSAYGNAVFAIRNKYKSSLEGRYSGGSVSDISSPVFTEFINSSAVFYEEASSEFLALKVPVSLAENHLSLINNYLSSSQAMRALANISQDPVSAYSALNTQVKNSREEEVLLSKIQTTLLTNGIIFQQGI